MRPYGSLTERRTGTIPNGKGYGGSTLVKKQMNADADDRKLLASVERGEWKSVGGGTRERARYARNAEATLRKDRRLNDWLSGKGLEATSAENITPRLLNM